MDVAKKKFLAALFGVILLIAAGCGADPEAAAVKTTTENFLNAQYEGGLDEAAKYMTDSAVEDMGTMEQLRDGLSMYEETGVSADTMDAFMNSLLKAYSLIWEKHEIGDVKVEGEKPLSW